MLQSFAKEFGMPVQTLVSAPGRVNLIGEHTDYNDGCVLPMAINKRITIGGALRNDDRGCVYSVNFGRREEFSLSSLQKQDGWIDYIKGVVDELQKAGYTLRGFNAVLYGDIPQGAGLSSSAALEVATAFFLAQLHEIDMPGEEMAKLCQRAENNFVSMNCGIMDQFISRLGKKNHALYIDCRDLSSQQVSCDLGEYIVVICNSNVEHKLVDSAYNERRSQCEEGVRLLKKALPDIRTLRDVSPAKLAEHSALLPSLLYQRCKHVVSENERVANAIDALKKNDIESFGRFLNQSHASLRDDYDVSCQEVDFLVDIAQNFEGVAGARITGGGFGGCTVNIVKESVSEEFQETLLHDYAEKTNIVAEIYTSKAEGGACLEDL
ncbi:galactokinase [candidate division KSB3 bacterium]|uniref:Galactokinase n=1 Tax=candidate division KSB3 bacterium TaxID=2044937 RepID=A0A2G6E4D5_9BACT|nr:MAG: galactokinase [candidate division KSB3 bacterium]PIE29509.1 MAG: galactokinase [candidate division KSB3 bacterium]